MTSLGLRNDPDGDRFPKDIVCTDSTVRLARINVIWGKSYKCTCKMHPRCYLFIEQRWFEHPLCVLYRWAALAKHATVEEHLAEAERLVLVGQNRASSSGSAAPRA